MGIVPSGAPAVQAPNVGKHRATDAVGVVSRVHATTAAFYLESIMRVSSLSVLGVLLPATLASASITVDGTVSGSEWAGASVIATTISGGLNGQVRVTSTSAGMYILGESTDDDAGTAGFDGFDINFGLVGNTAAWRYRIQSNNGPLGAGYGAIAGASNWGGRIEFGDDSQLSDPFYGAPGGTYTSTPIPSSVQWAVGLGNSSAAAVRVHEIFVPWSVILDGQNGWNAGASSLTFAFAGYLMQDGTGSVLTDSAKHGLWGNPSWGNQSHYANVTLAIPAPGAFALLGLAGLAGRRRR